MQDVVFRMLGVWFGAIKLSVPYCELIKHGLPPWP